MRFGRTAVVRQRLIKFDKLIDGFIADKGFTNEQNQIGVVYND